ncbi:hypothetical protein LEN26_015393 [Aphanomyces euteiches]|nr:hypothetical protein LEN26_015393 [Aphanomyces euteiches]KAH9115782.1 hypothetical protein AeMF1_010227 [Aphanomyces euteiches]KAH9146144.1 hypothetical protein AeRB84_009955 [Aphanomyces euteiches]KAH9197051.1 hypothetical protein AeNC1_000949 [Aphanomyces euteiches]
MGGAASKQAGAAGTSVVQGGRKIIRTSLKRQDLRTFSQLPEAPVVRRTPQTVEEMDNQVLREAERFQETIDSVQYVETDMTAFEATAASRRPKSDGPVRMPTDKTRASNSQTVVDVEAGRFTDRQFRELLRLHYEEPTKWTPAALASRYQVNPVTIEEILTHVCPPKLLPPTSTVSYPTGTWWK